MDLHDRSLLTIYTEKALETRLIYQLEKHGAPGYTISNASGSGSRGIRNAAWEADSNIRVEVICERELAMELAKFLQDKYYENYAMVMTLSEIEVFRPEKFKR